MSLRTQAASAQIFPLAPQQLRALLEQLARQS